MYSRATTSAMAERVVVGFLAADLDLGGIFATAKENWVRSIDI